MNENNSNNVLAVVGGGAVAAVTAWLKNEDDTQSRLRENRTDLNGVTNWIRTFSGRGEVLRSRLPVVQDFQCGLSAATAQQATPSVVPTIAVSTRPNLAAGMEAQVSTIQFPPSAGQYDSQGMLLQIGELGVLGEALSFEEPRALIQGTVQPTAPTAAQKVQIFRMINTLIAQATQQSLTWAEYQAAWRQLFGGQVAPQALDAHADPARAPMAVSVGAGVSIQPLSSSVVAGAVYANQNTDSASRWRLTIPTGSGVPGQTVLAHVTFGTEYRYRSAGGTLVPFQPIVVTSRPFHCYADNVTSTGFDLLASQSLSPGVLEVYVSVTAGHETL